MWSRREAVFGSLLATSDAWMQSKEWRAIYSVARLLYDNTTQIMLAICESVHAFATIEWSGRWSSTFGTVYFNALLLVKQRLIKTANSDDHMSGLQKPWLQQWQRWCPYPTLNPWRSSKALFTALNCHNPMKYHVDVKSKMKHAWSYIWFKPHCQINLRLITKYIVPIPYCLIQLNWSRSWSVPACCHKMAAPPCRRAAMLL